MNVQISLKTNDHWDVDSRVNEIAEIRDWIDELVGWEPGAYSMRFHSSGQRMIVWFEHDEHAMFFKLRWA
jgi:hypothetical protein